MNRKEINYTKLNLSKMRFNFILVINLILMLCIIILSHYFIKDDNLRLTFNCLMLFPIIFFSSFFIWDFVCKRISIKKRNAITNKYQISLGLIPQQSCYSYKLSGSTYYDVFIYGRNEYQISFEYYVLGDVVFCDQDKVHSFCYENKIKDFDFKNMVQEISDYITLSKKIYE